jgi:hypothetical protein
LSRNAGHVGKQSGGTERDRLRDHRHRPKGFEYLERDARGSRRGVPLCAPVAAQSIRAARSDIGRVLGDKLTGPYPAAITRPQVAYRRQYTPDLRSIKRKSIMPLRRLAVSGWRRLSRALICFSVYSRPGSIILDSPLLVVTIG